MKKVLEYGLYILLVALGGYLIWRFWFMIVWILVAAVVSFIGHPLVKWFRSIHIRKRHVPALLAALLSLALIILVFFGILTIFVPLIINQAETISHIDVDRLAENLQGPLQWLDERLHDFGVIPAGQSMQDFLVIKAKSLVSLGNITALFNSFFSFAGTIFIGLVSVLFIAFFFLRDEKLFENSLLAVIPVRHHEATLKVISESKELLMRYFIGVLLEVTGVMAIIAIGLWIFGVENALLIGFFGGIMNIIPYIGPVIGTILGLLLGITSILASGSFNELWPVLAKLGGVFLVANFIDNNFLVPMIYSKSVKAHPLEIFFVIIMGGSLAGIIGMLLAIPVYTVLRVIAREFFNEYRIVKKLTETIE